MGDRNDVVGGKRERVVWLLLYKEQSTHAKAITTKSSQFHASLRYVNGLKMKPRAITFTADSNV